jgi:hypothetical protein
LKKKGTVDLVQEIKILKNARKLADVAMSNYNQEFWQARMARRNIQLGITSRRIEVGRRRALRCPAFKREKLPVVWGSLGSLYDIFGCNGRTGRPYSSVKERLLLKCCSECKLPYGQIRTKMLMLKLDKENRRRLH